LWIENVDNHGDVRLRRPDGADPGPAM